MEPLPCFVWVDTSGRWADPHPGILLARRRVPDGRGAHSWEGWVVEAWQGGVPAHGQRLYVHQTWLSFVHLRPVGAQRPPADLRGFRPANR